MKHRGPSAFLLLVCLIAWGSAPAFAQERVNAKTWTALKQAAQGYLDVQSRHASSLKPNLPRITGTQDQLIELVGLAGHLPEYRTTLGMQAAVTVHANQVWPGSGSPHNLTGAGQVVGMWDGGGVRLTHQEFGQTGQVRVVQQDNPYVLNQHHATGVAGLIAAGGVDHNAPGIGYEATLWAYDWNGDLTEMMEAAQGGMLVSVHPYGGVNGWSGNLTLNGVQAPLWTGDVTIDTQEDYRFGFYTVQSQFWDNIVYNAPYYLPVKSAGNDRGTGPEAGTEHYHYEPGVGHVLSTTVRQQDGGAEGYDTVIGDAGVSKNVLTIGASVLIPTGYQSPNDVQVSSFSAWGPTDDGRIKPDLVAPGENLYTILGSSDTAYRTGTTGTSFSAPVVGGGISLLHQKYDALYPHAPAPMLAATVRALLYHTAFEAGPTGPDYQHGWGLLNVEGGIELMTQNAATRGGGRIQELTLEEGESLSFSLTTDGQSPLRLTMAWTDPAGDLQNPTLNDRQRKLVNDLDVRLVGPDGTTFFPWVLNPDVPQTPAYPGDNDRDNAEQIYVANPAPGTYTVYLSHKGTLADGLQRVSLVLSGTTQTGTAADLDADGLLSTNEDLNGDGNLDNDDTDQDGLPNYLDDDDDGDGIPTFEECADPNGDGNPDDACSTNSFGIPDYLYSASLPVELTQFQVEVQEGTAILHWQTATETNNAGFEIQMTQHGAAAWTTLGFVDGAGTSRQAQSYQYRVSALPAGRYGFRLRQVDFDGQFTFSPEVEAEIFSPGAFTVGAAYPNPAQGRAHVPLRVQESQDVTVRVFDMQGRVLGTLWNGYLLGGEAGTVAWQIPEGIPSGVYFIQVQGTDFEATRKLTVRR